MSGGNWRHTALWLAAACVMSLLVSSFGTETARAQTTRDNANGTVTVPVRQLNEIQKELRYLRQRDAERQVWENSLMKQLPAANFDLVSERYVSDEPNAPFPPACDTCPSSGCDGAGSGGTGCDGTGCDGTGCDGAGCDGAGCGGTGCGCYPCQCPLPPAPCLDCPHVSTLSPYFNVNIFGALKLDMLYNSVRPIAPGTPFFLTPDSPTGLDQNTMDIHARQSTLGAALAGPRVGNFQSGGLIVAMFFNDNVIADKYGILPLQAFGELKNEDWRFAGGLQFDVFNPGIPTVLPFSALSASGNAGNAFRGQLRLERFLHPADDVQWTIQGALSEPITSTVDPTFRLSEDNGWPNVEGRVALGVGALEGAGLAAKRPFELGVSGVVGQIRTTPPRLNDRVVADVWGLGADFRWKMTDCFGVMGELYTGQTLGTYNAGILQNINIDTLEGIRSSGAWIETFLYWTPCLHSHVGYGIDDPIDRDVANSLTALGRVRNSTYYSNLLWDLNQTFRVGFEFTWRETNYKTLRDNEGAGFHTQFQWAF